VIWLALGLAVLFAAPLAVEALRVPVRRRRLRGVPGEIISLPGGLTHVVREGPESGPVVVLVHGITTPLYVWAGIAPLLAEAGYRVIRYDLFGRGLSDRPRARQDADFFADQLEALLDHEGVEGPCVLVGYSMGGAVAATHVAGAPDGVAALVLIAPTGLAPAEVPGVLKVPVLGDWLMWMIGGRLQLRRLKLLEGGPSVIPDFHGREAEEAGTRGYARSVISALRQVVLRDFTAEHVAVAKAGVPVLAIWGAEDRSVPIASAGRLAEVNPDARQHQIDGVGHGLPHTRPGEVAAEILRFLKERSGRS